MTQNVSEEAVELKHERNCHWWGSYGDSECTCSLKKRQKISRLRRQLTNEADIASAWKAKYEAAEARNATARDNALEEVAAMMKQRGHMSTDDVRKLKSISPPSQTTRDDAVLLRLLDFDRQYRAERGKSGAFTYSPQNVVAAFRQQEQSK